MSGTSLALSASGQVLAVGTSRGIQVFNYNVGTDKWISLGDNKYVTDTKQEANLSQVSLSQDGMRLVGGDPNWSSSRGHVAVFCLQQH